MSKSISMSLLGRGRLKQGGLQLAKIGMPLQAWPKMPTGLAGLGQQARRCGSREKGLRQTLPCPALPCPGPRLEGCNNWLEMCGCSVSLPSILINIHYALSRLEGVHDVSYCRVHPPPDSRSSVLFSVFFCVFVSCLALLWIVSPSLFGLLLVILPSLVHVPGDLSCTSRLPRGKPQSPSL